LKKLGYINIIIFFLLSKTYSQELTPIKELSGSWKFSLGDNIEWSSPKFNDSDWKTITVPGSWEEQGYYGYDGIAWYRKSFNAGSDLQNQNLYIELGYIDDVDEVFINGVKIGATGTFPPFYKTAYNSHRIYFIPKKLVKTENIIAVRVFDEHLEGGIIQGKIQLLKEKLPMEFSIELQGYWKFKKGDDVKWADLEDYSGWDDIIVPGLWENQGYKNYDGFAWYVIQFTPDESLAKESLVMVLGKIDDIDQLYINGQFIASTGEFKGNINEINCTFEYNEQRGYYIPKGVIKPNVRNTIAVRIYDCRGDGGIYKGPVGIITQDNYIEYWKNKKGLRTE